MSNRLVNEKSPYLLQHSENPVDWYPWGDEAFEKAKRENKPVFLSIGYSTCHWCHVMERESFEDEEVAKLMNEAFVSVKVDREERPDVDNVYMTVCHIISKGNCGWPLSIVMTPEGEPFFAGTYIPKENRYGRMGMLELVPRIRRLWEERKDEVLGSARQVTEAVRAAGAALGRTGGAELDEKTLDRAYEHFLSAYDRYDGGFGAAPKFPSPHNLMFLMRYYARTGRKAALNMVERTLAAMGRGGICDHVGFGFHRYSTDREWLVPHFEKMLYDQALLAIAYVEAWQITKEPFYEEKAREILDYLLRDMLSPEGGFYSAEDADSEGVEGRFYVWTAEEFGELAGPEDAELLSEFYDVSPEGNFRDEATGEPTGLNILRVRESVEDFAAGRGISPDALRGKLRELREKLFSRRERRVHPYKDDKILTDWNGITTAALCRAGTVLGEEKYLAAARDCVEFVRKKLVRRGELLHRYREAEAGIPASVDDYAFFVWGLLECYESSFDEEYLSLAVSFCRKQLERFWDDEAGGFFFTAQGGEKLIARQKEIYDGALPSGNSVSMLNVLRIARLTADVELEKKAEEMARCFSSVLANHPHSFSMCLVALDFMLGPCFEIVIAGERNLPSTARFTEALAGEYLPNKVVIVKDTENEGRISEIAPYTREQTPVDGKPAAYVCVDYECSLPVVTVERMLELVGEAKTPRKIP